MARKNTIQWVQTNTNFWTFQICKKTVAFITSKGVNNDSFVLNANVLDEFIYHGYPLKATSIEGAKKEVEALFEKALIPIKLNMAKKIGEYFGDYVESDGKFSIDNGEREFVYDTVDELLADWLETVLANHHDAYYIEKNRLESDSWEKEIVFIYSMVLQELPKGVKPSGSSSGDGFSWIAYCDVSLTKDNRPNDMKGHSKTLCAGTFNSLAEAIFNQQKLEERVKSKKYTLEELSEYATSLRCRVEWEQYGKTSYNLKLCGNGVATIYVVKSPDTPDKFTYSSQIHSTYWHSNCPLKAETLEEAKVELENIILDEYEKYLGELEISVAIYKDRVKALNSLKKAVSDNV